MLVKISDVWINPDEVKALETMSVPDGEIKIILNEGSWVHASGVTLDSVAEIINNSLQTQSFGGDSGATGNS